MNRLRVRILAATALVVVATAAGALPAQAAEVNDETVRDAIEKGRKYLIARQNPDGSFGQGGGEVTTGCYSALVFMTLAYMGEHPNRPYMTKGLDYLLALDAERGFGHRQGYAVPIRLMGLSYVYKKLIGEKQNLVKMKMNEDVMRMVVGQRNDGGWRYRLNAAEDHDFDFSVSQWPILAFREANLVGVEFPAECLRRAQQLYFKYQRDGGWAYQTNGEAYGSMTAAGLASLFIITDVLEPASGCPCNAGRSQIRETESLRRIDLALDWLGQNFSASENPKKRDRHLYWLYCVERVGIAAGYKYFGFGTKRHDWYREGAAAVLKARQDDHWGTLDDTCFALLFLYKGRAPVLFNKLKFDGIWNAHRRDVANLTNVIERAEEQQFHWQIVDLGAPLDELHDAPILYISAESAPKWSGTDAAAVEAKKKLRAFTDTGGTVLFEASCGNPSVRKWFSDFAREVWPEWRLQPLGSDHGVWQSHHKIMKDRPEVLGISDGVRTFVFYSIDDISCAWQTRALVAKQYLFNWGFNLYRYATDGAPLRAKLSGLDPDKTSRYKDPVKAGPRATLRVARVRYGGNWEAGANYGTLQRLASRVKAKAGITLDIKESAVAPVTESGVAATALSGYDVAYITGSTAIALKPEEKEALKTFVAGGGFIWAEATAGSTTFEKSLQQLVGELGWQLKALPNTHGLLTGRMESGVGYNLTSGVAFHATFEKKDRPSRPFAELWGIYQGDKMVGVFSPFDFLYSLTGYEAYYCRGYRAADAAAVGTNLAIFTSTLQK